MEKDRAYQHLNYPSHVHNMRRTSHTTQSRTRARALALSSSTTGGTIHREGKALCCSSKVVSAGMHSYSVVVVFGDGVGWLR